MFRQRSVSFLVYLFEMLMGSGPTVVVPKGVSERQLSHMTALRKPDIFPSQSSWQPRRGLPRLGLPSGSSRGTRLSLTSAMTLFRPRMDLMLELVSASVREMASWRRLGKGNCSANP